MYCFQERLLMSNSSAKRLAKPNSVYVTGTDNFCLDVIKQGMKVLLPLIIIFSKLLFGPMAFPHRLMSYFTYHPFAFCPKKLVLSTGNLQCLLRLKNNFDVILRHVAFNFLCRWAWIAVLCVFLKPCFWQSSPKFCASIYRTCSKKHKKSCSVCLFVCWEQVDFPVRRDSLCTLGP